MTQIIATAASAVRTDTYQRPPLLSFMPLTSMASFPAASLVAARPATGDCLAKQGPLLAQQLRECRPLAISCFADSNIGFALFCGNEIK
jgi:hypothetical protein